MSEASNGQGGGRRVLLTGATGYVGGRLLGLLESRGEAVRCLARHPEHLRGRVGRGTEVVAGDLLDEGSLEGAMAGVDAAYYLVHSLGMRERFEEAEREAAENFAGAAARQGVRRIIYLGGLGQNPDSSPHLRSRRRVGEVLRASGVPTIEFRASIIIGSGSLSFELIRALARKLPVMMIPKWGRTPIQPIAIEDVLAYLVQGLDRGLGGESPGSGAVYEIGGPDVVRYVDLLTEYARQRGLVRLMIPAPVLTPGLSSLWLGLVTPIYARVGRKLIDSTQTAMEVVDDGALRAFDVRPRGFREAIARALSQEDQTFAETRWNDALSSTVVPRGFGGERFGSRLVDSRRVTVAASPSEAFAPIRKIGGRRGWYFADPLWAMRGFMDLLVGGVGLRRGRRDPEQLRVGDTVDFWRVEAVAADQRLLLRAEMKVPGRAWLQFEVEPAEHEGAGGVVRGAQVRQTAIFDPRGLFGLAYWYALWPLHELVFAGMLRAIARRAEAEAGSD
mgnify:CR=1 FL=1